MGDVLFEKCADIHALDDEDRNTPDRTLDQTPRGARSNISTTRLSDAPLTPLYVKSFGKNLSGGLGEVGVGLVIGNEGVVDLASNEPFEAANDGFL